MSGKNLFTTVKLQKPQRSEFDMSYFSRMSGRIGTLYPCFVKEVIPSDSWSGSVEALVRMAPPLAPIYETLEMYVHIFFVPNRLLWDGGGEDSWETFITGGRLGVGIDPLTAPIPPYIDIGSMFAQDATIFDESRLADYLGVPLLKVIDPTIANWNGKHLDVMPFLAYQLIWFEYYRDRNFVADDYFDVPIPAPGGAIAASDFHKSMALYQRAWRHDYFTSALPFTQRGEEVLVPMEGLATINYLGNALFTKSDGTHLQAGAASFGGTSDKLIDTSSQVAKVVNIDTIEFNNTSVSINDFRTAYALQVWYERNAVGGSRYTESIQAHFAVRPQDSRLQRPEYLGGGRIPIKVSEVVSTAYAVNQDDDSVPQANLAGHGIAYGDTNQFKYFATEHGFIMGIISVMNPPSYHQGMPRMFYARRSFLGYMWPTFAKLGEQTVHKAELYCNPASLVPDANGEFPIFGYQSRYADWKYSCNTNRGAFHSTLLFWTLTNDYSSSPVLGNSFVIYPDALGDRIFAVNDAVTVTDHLWFYIHNSLTVRRALPYFGTPNTLGFV